MSETIIDHGYIPEEHAPDPVTSHGDPTPPGKIAIWLFLASEIMFFIGILGTYIILRSGSPKLFEHHAAALSKPLAGTNTLVLIFSSLTMALSVDAAQKGNRKRLIWCLALTLLCAFGFMGIKTVEYATKFSHWTIVTRAPSMDQTNTQYFVYDGHVVKETADEIELVGWRAQLPSQNFNINLVSEHDIESSDSHVEFKHDAPAIIKTADLNQRINYGPWKNVFYASYFTTTGVHGLHVIGGIIPIFILLVQAIRGKILPAHTEYIGLYWHFVDLVWIFLFPLLYLI